MNTLTLMVGESDTAPGALGDKATLLAEETRRISPSIEKEDDLLSFGKTVLDFLTKQTRKNRVFFLPHIHHLYWRQWPTVNPMRERAEVIFPFLSLIKGFKRRGCAP